MRYSTRSNIAAGGERTQRRRVVDSRLEPQLQRAVVTLEQPSQSQRFRVEHRLATPDGRLAVLPFHPIEKVAREYFADGAATILIEFPCDEPWGCAWLESVGIVPRALDLAFNLVPVTGD